MKGIKIVAANETLFIKAAQISNLSVIKLPKIRIQGYVFYRVAAPFSQQDIFNLGTIYSKLVASWQPAQF